MISILLSDKAYIGGLSSDMKYDIAKELTIVNPAYHKALSRGQRWTKQPPTFKYLEHTGSDDYQCSIPIGYIRRLINILDSKKLKWSIKDERIGVKRDMCYKKIQLRDYQEAIMERIKGKEFGIIQASTGSGKSFIFLHLASQVIANGGKAIIVTTRSNLVAQMAKDCEEHLMITPNLLPAKKKKYKNDSPITIASASTLQKLKQENKHFFEYDMVLFDELHMYCSEKRERMVMSFKSKYRFACSATPYNENGKQSVIGWVFGDVIAKYEAMMIKPSIKVVTTNFRFYSEDYNEIANELANDVDRNKLILKAVKSVTHNRAMILTKRHEQNKALLALLDDEKANYISLDAKTKPKEREDALRKAEEFGDKMPSIIGTYALLGVGISVDDIDLVVFAGDIKSENSFVQSAGRATRLFEGKHKATVIDIWDEYNPILRTHGLKRIKKYKEMGWRFNKLKI